MSDLLLHETGGGIARLTLNDPDRLNPLSAAMLEALSAALTRIAGEDGTRVVILAAAGRAFSAGHDLREVLAARQAGTAETLFARCAAVMGQIAALPQPVIAAVQGTATAAGCQLVATCDLALASETARFGVTGVNLGLFCATPMVALTRAVPPRAAFEMLVTGEMIPAPRAEALGLVTRCVPAGALMAEAQALAATIAARQPVAIRLGKRAFRAQGALPVEAAYALTARVMAENLADPGTAAGIAAFLDRRKPSA